MRARVRMIFFAAASLWAQVAWGQAAGPVSFTAKAGDFRWVVNSLAQQVHARFELPNDEVLTLVSAWACDAASGDALRLVLKKADAVATEQNNILRITYLPHIIAHLNLEQVPVREALRAAFGAAKISYSVQGDLNGKVTVHAENVPLRTAVAGILDQVGGHAYVEEGVYNCVPKNWRRPVLLQETATVDYDAMEIHQALYSLFKKSANTLLAGADVHGNVTLHAQHVPFDVVLKNLLKQVDATYHLAGGVFIIQPLGA
jgi:hypothetical protein